ncbi:MAG TPA: beta-galactosidase, partial [Cyclobacteriaceae bacterium]|nr:beta-galactosidase [Cyclobacteriaceae bacterium]
WAEDAVKTTGNAFKLIASADREIIQANGRDLAFITIQVADANGLSVPRSNNSIEFSIEGPGEIVATDNGDPTNMESFSAKKREAFNGLCLAIVRSKAGETGNIIVTAKSENLQASKVSITCK